MQPWRKPASPAIEDVSSASDGFAFVLEQNAAGLGPEPPVAYPPRATAKILRLSGHLPAAAWCRLGTQVLPRLGQGTDVRIGIDISATLEAGSVSGLETELREILRSLGLANSIFLES